jgi:hypothetical protein
VDIDKGWHGLHFLFTGTADGGEERACYLVRGGEEIWMTKGRRVRCSSVSRTCGGS